MPAGLSLGCISGRRACPAAAVEIEDALQRRLERTDVAGRLSRLRRVLRAVTADGGELLGIEADGLLLALRAGCRQVLGRKARRQEAGEFLGRRPVRIAHDLDEAACRHGREHGADQLLDAGAKLRRQPTDDVGKFTGAFALAARQGFQGGKQRFEEVAARIRLRGTRHVLQHRLDETEQHLGPQIGERGGREHRPDGGIARTARR